LPSRFGQHLGADLLEEGLRAGATQRKRGALSVKIPEPEAKSRQHLGRPGRVVKPGIQLPDLLYKIATDTNPVSMIG
jgi:hypothetical protein